MFSFLIGYVMGSFLILIVYTFNHLKRIKRLERINKDLKAELKSLITCEVNACGTINCPCPGQCVLERVDTVYSEDYYKNKEK